MPLTPKRAVAEAITMSQLATSWQPAAVARPATSATTGFGSATDRLHHARAAAEDVFEIGAAAVGIAAVRRHLLQVMAAARRAFPPRR